MADELSEPLPANDELRHDTEIDVGIHSFVASGVAPAAIQEFAHDLAAAAPAVQQATLIRTDARKAELHRAAKNSSEWMVPAPLVKEKWQKRQRLGRKPKKMTAPEWQRHVAQKVAAVAANNVAARARIAALAEVELLERIPVSTRVYAMKQFESFPKFFQNHQMLLKAFWHKLTFPTIAYTELIKLYLACSTRQNLQKHLDTVIVGYQNTAMFMQEQRLSDEVMRELSTITKEEHALMDLRIMKAMSTSLRAKQDAVHAEFENFRFESCNRTRAQSALSKFREHACILCAMLESHVHFRLWNRDMQLALRKARPSWGHAYQDLQYTMPNFHDPHY